MKNNYITKTLTAIAIPAILTFSGCGTVNGLSKDIGDASRYIENSTQKYVDSRDENVLLDAESKRQVQIDKAAALINSRYQTREK